MTVSHIMPARVFCPKQIEARGKIIVGWQNASDNFVAVAALPYIPLPIAERLLERDLLFSATREARELYNRAGSQRLRVLASPEEQERCPLLFEADGEVSCRGSAVQLIYYNPPNAVWMQYFSLEPIRLFVGRHDHSELHPNITKHSLGPSSDNLRQCLAQINCSYELSALLRDNAAKIFPEALKTLQRRRSSLSQSALMLEKKLGVRAKILRCLIAIVVALRIFCDAAIHVLEIEVRGHTIKEVSATAQQVDLRLRRMRHIPDQYLMIRKRRKQYWPVSDANVEYIRLYNNLWLAVNDTILGTYLGKIVLERRDLLATGVTWLTQECFGSNYRIMVLWLMSWPAGFKLNNELAYFFGEVLVWIIEAWRRITFTVDPITRSAWIIVVYAGYGGITLQLCLVYDILRLLTFHVYCFYQSGARVYRNLVTLLIALFRVFRGKKFNPLRNRVDSGDFDLNQLLFGTILFTVGIFLLPTVGAFYIAFTLSRLGLVATYSLFELVLAFLNHFPLFPLLLRIKSPGRVPGGIRFEVCRGGSALLLRTNPIGLKQLFSQYSILAHWFVSHYFSPHVLWGLITGDLVPLQRAKLYSLLYSMLPNQPYPVPELWGALLQAI